MSLRLPCSSIFLHLSTVCLLSSNVDHATHDFSKNYKDTCCVCLRVSLVRERSLNASQTLCEHYYLRIREIILQVISLSFLPLFFFIKRELMDCFFDGNRTIRAIEGVVSEQSECICTRDFALPACRPMIRGGNIPIPRYMASSRELLSLIPSIYIVPHSTNTNLVYTNACFSFSLFFFPFLFSFFLSFF